VLLAAALAAAGLWVADENRVGGGGERAGTESESRSAQRTP